MKKFLFFSILVKYCIWIGCCVTKKRQATTLPGITAKHVELESKHYADYLLNQDAYLNWPELDRGKMEETCENYVKKFFRWKRIVMKEFTIIHIEVHYRGIKDKNGNNAFGAIVAFQCRISRRSAGLDLFVFARASTLNCLHLMNSLYKRVKSKFYIAAEICEHHTYDELKKNGDLTCVTSITSNENVPVYKQKIYEMEHLENYLLMPDSYINWPEFKDKDKHQKCCQILLRRHYPKTWLQDLKTSYDSLVLHYVRIKTTEGKEYDPVKVAALMCETVKYHGAFVRAPDLKCVYLVRRSQAMVEELPAPYSIVKYLCDKRIIQNNALQILKSENKENETVNQRGSSSVNEEWDWDIPIDTGPIELKWI